MAYLMTYICSNCTWPTRRLCQVITRDAPPWALLDYCEKCRQRSTFLRDVVHSDGFIDDPPVPQILWHLYLMKADNGLYKIGISTNPANRHKSLSTGPIAVNLIWSKELPDAPQIEKTLHWRFRSKRIRGEWFNLDKADIEYIRRLADGH